MDKSMGPPAVVREIKDGSILSWEIDQRAYAFASDVPRMFVIATFDKSGVMTGMRRSGSLFAPIRVPVLPIITIPVPVNERPEHWP